MLTGAYADLLSGPVAAEYQPINLAVQMTRTEHLGHCTGPPDRVCGAQRGGGLWSSPASDGGTVGAER